MILHKLAHVLGLKRRHLFTKSGSIRLRVAAVPLVALAAASFMIPGSSADKTAEQQNLVTIEQAVLTETALPTNELEGLAHPDVETLLTEKTPEDIQAEALAAKILKIVHRPAQKPDIRRFTMKSGDSLSVLLERASFSPGQSYEITQALSKQIDPRDLKAGQKIDIEYVRDADGNLDLKTMSLPVSQLEKVTLNKTLKGYEAKKQTKTFKMHKRAATAEIGENASSLYLALNQQDVPHDIIAETIRAYSWDIDFQRDIWTGNKISVYYEKAIDEDGDSVSGKSELIFAHLKTNHKDLPIYRFKEKDKDWNDFFHLDGRSVRMLLLSTPVDGARLSSGFGHRKHPILGYTKMHKGVDFAAPTGTPIYAAGDGVVERASTFSSYGKYIRIRHKGSLKTAYAHLHGYAKGIKAGAKVKQGQTIGYIGSTGRSTGPHLHYEVLQNGVHINPRSLKLPTGDKLKGAELARFQKEAKAVDKTYKAIIERKSKFAARLFD